jgi:hypothetical protein
MTVNLAEKAASTWPSSVCEEFEANQFNGQVGTRLLSETDRVRVWEIRLPPGERIGFHWTAVTPGRARSHRQDGSVVEATYAAGDTRHYVYSRDEYNIHDLENVGDTDLWFTTVEFLDSANKPLELSADVGRPKPLDEALL